jgi:hypothetical protein
MQGHELPTLVEKIRREVARARRRYLDKYVKQYGISAGVRRVRREIDLRSRFVFNPVRAKEDTFLLARIIGNDLEPRHRTGQSRENVEFILKNEPDFPGVKKLWIINRIYDADERKRIVDVLERNNQEYRSIDFDLSEYGKAEWELGRLPSGAYVFDNDYRFLEDRIKQKLHVAVRRHKVLYAMNNNGARNFALNLGRSEFKWIMPWDGNCFLTEKAFANIVGKTRGRPYLPYLIVPMLRVEDNALLLDPGFSRPPREEPQIIFRTDAKEQFDEELPYGRRPKVDLLWRLGVPGKWDRIDPDPWDLPKAEPTAESGKFQRAGWVARLDSGRPELEMGDGSSRLRAITRDDAILLTIDRLDSDVVSHLLATRPDPLLYYDLGAISASVEDRDLSVRLRAAADAALQREPSSVIQKARLPPSGTAHDYLSPAPYWWPTAGVEGGTCHVRRDGERAPESELFQEGSSQFDRSGLQRLFDDTTVLALAWHVLGDRAYAERAGECIRTWFLDKNTRMNPHLHFAQIVGEKPSQKGYGILEFKDVYYFLDAVWMIEQSGVLQPKEIDSLRAWFSEYAHWLDNDAVAKAAFRLKNNLGLYFDIQRLAIANFLRETAVISRAGLYSRARIHGQIALDGSLPRELTRAKPKHYSLFAAQGWTTMARLLSAFGDDLWKFNTEDRRGIEKMLEWVVGYSTGANAAPSGEEVDQRRLAPLLADLKSHYGKQPTGQSSGLDAVDFHPGTAIPPFWTLRRR